VGGVQLDLMVPGLPLRQATELARDAASAGMAGVVVTETGRTAYLTCAALALAGEPLDILTGIAVAFPRSPMVTAQVAWELAEASGGRFRLGLGSQVRAHIERRFGMPYDPPGPRMREYLLALRAAFRAFRGEEPLAFEGRYWSLRLLPAAWSPGPIPVPDPPVDLAAVNPWMLRLAGELADGVHVHPLNTEPYLRETVLPALAEGAARAGRQVADLTVICPAFVAAGDRPGEVERWWERARAQVAFYGSTPNYRFLFEQLGRPEVPERIRARQKAGDLAGMAKEVDDELLGQFCVAGDWATVADALRARYGGVASRVVSYFAGQAWLEDRRALGPWGELARALAG
jgi:probable F420-dependent oxidoreductase